MNTPVPTPTFNLADLWELVVTAVPDQTAIVDGDRRLTFAEVDDRASRLAAWMRVRGVRPGSFVGVQMRNAAEFIEVSMATHKLRAVAVNVNYRLTPTELVHLYNDGPLVGVVHDAELGEDVAAAVAISADAPWTLARGDDYEHAATVGPAFVPVPRSGDDPYVLYTGGTTGLPKGVVWRSEDAFFSCIGGGDPRGEHGPVTRPEDLLDRLQPGGAFLPAAPLIHAAGFWTSMRWLLAGVTVVLHADFSADRIWAAIERERVHTINIVGDAMAGPLADALDARPDRDLACLRTLASGGAPLTAGPRGRLLGHLPQLTIKDSYGSSETGVHGHRVHTCASEAATNEPGEEARGTAFQVFDTVVLDPETYEELPPGSPTAGIVARRGRVPLAYHRDPDKTAGTFPTIGGTRYALTGDLALHEADGSVRVLGRGSQCINSGGEKILPEEVEAVLREHPDVADAIVVGLDDPRWGQRVTAVLAVSPGRTVTEAEVRDHVRAHLAAFKVPKDVVLVGEVQRTPAGKPDYCWARSAASDALAAAGGRA